jgi:hypothetical protein
MALMYSIVVLCSFWLILTIAIQFDSSLASKLLRFDLFGLLPRWMFFAPNPAHKDLRVFVRFGLRSGVSSWYELWLSHRIDEHQSFLRGLINPYRRLEKLLSDFSNALGVPGISPSQVRLSSEYIALLGMAEAVAQSEGFDKVQFMVAETNYSLADQFQVVMISDLHSVVRLD